MIRYDAGTTNPTLLSRLGDWRDHEAWVDFVMRYDPVIRSTSSRYRLDAETTDELCQRVWIDLARRMRSFRWPDPGRSISRLGCRLCQSRAIDLLRKKKADAAQTLEFHVAASLFQDAADRFDAEEGTTSERPLLLWLAQEVQDGVRRRVEERTWEIIWKIEYRRGVPCRHAPRPKRSSGSHILRRAVRASRRWKPTSRHAPPVRASSSDSRRIRRRARITSRNDSRRGNNLPRSLVL